MSTVSEPEKSHTPTGPAEGLREWSSLIGIVTAIIGNVLIALALNVQRYAHTRLHKERLRVRQGARAVIKDTQRSSSSNDTSYGTIPARCDGPGVENDPADALDSVAPVNNARGRRSSTGSEGSPEQEGKATSTYLKSPYWWLGQILITLGEMGNFLAYGFAPASIVSPLGVVALISNCIIAPVMFHERFRARDFWGVVIAVAGVVTVVFSANQEETKLEPHDVWHAIATMEFEIYLGVTVSLILILMWASGRYGRRIILIDLGLVGLFGGYTALATKGVSSMLSSTLWMAFATPVTYVLLVILLGTAIMQVRYVNRALQWFDSTQVIPVQFVLFTLCVILGSAILYRDFEKTTPNQAACFVGGCLLTFFGVFLITSGRRQKEQDGQDALSEIHGIEETIGLASNGEGLGAPALRCHETPMPKSRRSSILSRVSFADTAGDELGDKLDAAAATTTALPQQAGSAGAPPPLIAIGSDGLVPENPWRESWSSNASPRSDCGAVSADSVATSSALIPNPGNWTVTPSTGDAATPPWYPTDQAVTARHSLGSAYRAGSHHGPETFISPSPLSSTVTTVVKDAFLRENASLAARQSSPRRIRSSIRASLFFKDGDAEPSRPSEPRFATCQRGAEDGSADADAATRRRARSLSDAIGDFFRSRRK
ncbi:uncharacterized protein UV8b_06300 [Ustilaginoidea virens]|uniref:DUF803 domain membrane protein n=1 Tax=Ustilaginoidea virens TaxID=1159556 RepID=A0A8E5HV05_USTVR|nr:uncharacterized protein UV8b_06300 [Ustilaginoidea virens]QUC22059.1 hypothetical protein UV8b_06300 [Ustilaginoidea virens]